MFFGFVFILLFFTAGTGATDEDVSPHLDYQEPYWCHPPGLTNGEVTCRSPRGGGASRSTLGTRCEMRCDRGFRLSGRSSIQCLPNRRWSATAICRKMRCPVLPLIQHGRYSCTRRLGVDSRCDFTCDPGYLIQGNPSRICQHGSTWSGTQPACADIDPPKVKCPPSRLRVAGPGTLTSRVTWNPPTAKDTADETLDVILVGQVPGSDFTEGGHVLQYIVYDQTRNRATCRFMVRVEVRRCPELAPPIHGDLTCSSDGNNYGATCDHRCHGGHDLIGPSRRVCQFNRSWSDQAAQCVPMQIKADDVNSAPALLDQFYQKRRLLIISAPNVSDSDYQLQNILFQNAECGLDLRHVTVIELIGSPPRQTGRIKESLLQAEVIEGLRRSFRISSWYFSLVLLNKLGMDQERFLAPLEPEGLFSFIDSFMMEEEERERLQLHQHFCDQEEESPPTPHPPEGV